MTRITNLETVSNKIDAFFYPFSFAVVLVSIILAMAFKTSTDGQLPRVWGIFVQGLPWRQSRVRTMPRFCKVGDRRVSQVLWRGQRRTLFRRRPEERIATTGGTSLVLPRVVGSDRGWGLLRHYGHCRGDALFLTQRHRASLAGRVSSDSRSTRNYRNDTTYNKTHVQT